MTHSYHYPPCHLCSGKCCQYFALEIDKPTTLQDFENIKWYILHKDTFVFADDNEWFLQINNPCKYLGEDFKCTIYENRPSICREYGFDDDKNVMCDKITDHMQHDLTFYSIEEIDNYILKRFPQAKKHKTK